MIIGNILKTIKNILKILYYVSSYYLSRLYDYISEHHDSYKKSFKYINESIHTKEDIVDKDEYDVKEFVPYKGPYCETP